MNLFRKMSLLFLTMGLLTACSDSSPTSSSMQSSDEIESITKNSEHTLTLEESTKDAHELINTIEETHPIFLDDFRVEHPEIQMPSIPELYEQKKKSFLNSLKEGMAVEDFLYNAQLYIASLNDAHTKLTDMYSGTIVSLDRLPVHWRYDGKNLIVDQNNSSIPMGAKIVSIGGIEVSKLTELAIDICSIENETSKNLNISSMLRKKFFLTHTEAKVTDNLVEISYTHNENMSTALLSFVTNNVAITEKEEPNVQGEIVGDKYVFKLRSFQVDKQLQVDEQFTAEIEKMKKAIESGVKTVVIDLRGNGGGYFIPVATPIFKALGMRMSENGTIKRKSDALLKQTNWNSSNFNGKSYYFSNSKVFSENPKQIKLYVLIDEHSGSASVAFAAITQDGSYGRIVGQIPYNNASMFADILEFRLTNSHLSYTCSTAYNFRPNSKVSNELIPDMTVPTGEDIMKYLEMNK